MTSRDDLTGAYMAQKFKEEAERLMAENPDRKYAVLYIDIENFKYINDVFGYAFGDEILRAYAAVMMADMGEKEVFGREVADRFLALRCYEEKDELLERQQQADRRFSEAEEGRAGRHLLTVACGICCIEDVIEKLDIDALIDRANYAQKVIKNDPGLHYSFYNESIRQNMRRDNQLKDKIEQAIEREEFVVYMQPKVDVRTRKVAGAEALVRWQSSEGKIIQPGVFIPVMEKSGTIGALDRYVFEQVCKWAAGRIEKRQPVVPISINVSKLQFYNSGFVEEYRDIKERYKIPDGLLEIEFTETVAFDGQVFMMNIVKQLHESGFRCSIDDFGTGYSSLGMLKDLHIDTLKLDAMFFRKSTDLEKEQLIVSSIIRMISKLNITTVAEGIEEESQVSFLKEAGCDLIQGFVFFKPMPLDKFAHLLEKEAGKKGMKGKQC